MTQAATASAAGQSGRSAPRTGITPSAKAAEASLRSSTARDETRSSHGTTAAASEKGSTSTETSTETTTAAQASVLRRHGLEISPARGEFVNFDLDTTYVIRFRICNVSSEMRTLRFRGPNSSNSRTHTAKNGKSGAARSVFRVTDLRSVQLAPGLSHTLEVEFVTERMQDYGGTGFTVFTSQQDTIEVPLVAWCLPRLHVPAKIDFGAVEHRRAGLVRPLRLRNGGRRDARLHCRVVDSPLAAGVAVLTMHPTSTVVARAMEECTIALELAPVLPPGKHAIRLAVDMECVAQGPDVPGANSTTKKDEVTKALPTHYVTVLVEVVDCRSTLLDAASGQETRAVSFATIYAGAEAVKEVVVVNGSEQPVSYAFQSESGGGDGVGREGGGEKEGHNTEALLMSRMASPHNMEVSARMPRGMNMSSTTHTPGLVSAPYTAEDHTAEGNNNNHHNTSSAAAAMMNPTAHTAASSSSPTTAMMMLLPGSSRSGAFRVVPEQGRLAPKERRVVRLLFSPPLNLSRKGWWSTNTATASGNANSSAVMGAEGEEEEELHNYEASLALRFVETEQTHHLHLSGSAAETAVWLSETVLDFGTCPLHTRKKNNNNRGVKEEEEEGEEEVKTLHFELHNRTHNVALVMHFTIAHVAHFQVTPQAGRVPAGTSVPIAVTFRPHRLGHFSVALPICVNQTVNREVTLRGRAVAEPPQKRALGVSHTHDAAATRAARDAAEAMQRAMSTAQGETVTNHNMALTDDARTKVAQSDKASHRKNASAALHARECATATVVDLGMTPAAGLRPPQPTLHQFRKEGMAAELSALAKGANTALQDAGAHSLLAAAAAAAAGPSSLGGAFAMGGTPNGALGNSHVVPMNFDLRALIKRRYAAVPANAKERRDCRRELCAAELLQLMLPIKHIEFGRVTIGAAVMRPFYVYNGTAASVLIEMPSEDLVTRFTPHAQIVPAMRMAEFDVELRSAALQACQQVVSCNVNGRHQIRFTVQAEVVPVEVTLSQHDVLLRFCEFTEEPVTRGGVTLFNHGNSDATYRWRLAPTPGLLAPQTQPKTAAGTTNTASSVITTTNTTNTTNTTTNTTMSTPFTISPAEGVLPAAARAMTEITFTPPPGELHYECDAILEVDGAVGPQVLRLRAEVDPTSCAWSKQAMALYGGGNNTTTSASSSSNNKGGLNSSAVRLNNGTTSSSRHAELTVELHRIPIGQPTRFTVGVYNRGARNAYFTLSKLPDWLTVMPCQGRICAHETEELVMQLCSTSLAGPVQATVLCQVRGMRRPLRLHLSAVFVAPPLSVTAPRRVNGAVLLDYGEVYVGASAVRQVCLQNFGDVEAIVNVDLQPCPDFELLMPGLDGEMEEEEVDGVVAAAGQLSLLHSGDDDDDEDEDEDEDEDDEEESCEEGKDKVSGSHVNSTRSTNAATSSAVGFEQSGEERPRKRSANGNSNHSALVGPRKASAANNTGSGARSSDATQSSVRLMTNHNTNSSPPPHNHHHPRRQHALVRPVADQVRQYTVLIPALCEVEVGIRYKPSAPRETNTTTSTTATTTAPSTTSNGEAAGKTSEGSTALPLTTNNNKNSIAATLLQARWSQVGSDEMHLLPTLQLRARAMAARLSLSCPSMDFPLAVVGSVVRPRELIIRNVSPDSNEEEEENEGGEDAQGHAFAGKRRNRKKPIAWRLQPTRGGARGAALASHFLIEPSAGVLGPGGTQVVSVTFLAQQAGSVRCDFDLVAEDDDTEKEHVSETQAEETPQHEEEAGEVDHTNGNMKKKKKKKSSSSSCGQLVLRASATRPRLSCARPAVVFPAVPLGVAVRSVIYLTNEGFDLIHVRYENNNSSSSTTTSNGGGGGGPIAVDFPRGNALSATQKELPVGLTFCCHKPITLSSSIVLRTDKEEAVTVAVAGSALNSILLTEHFVRSKEDAFAIRPSPAVFSPFTNASISAVTSATTTMNMNNNNNNNALSASFAGGLNRSTTSVHTNTASNGLSKAARMAAAQTELQTPALLYTCQLCDCRGETGPAMVYDPAHITNTSSTTIRHAMSRSRLAQSREGSPLLAEDSEVGFAAAMGSPSQRHGRPAKGKNNSSSNNNDDTMGHEDEQDREAEAAAMRSKLSMLQRHTSSLAVQDECYGMIDTVLAAAQRRSIAALQPLLDSLVRWMNRSVLRNPVDKLLETLPAMHGGLLYDVIERLLGKRPKAQGAAMSRRSSSFAMLTAAGAGAAAASTSRQRSRSGSSSNNTNNNNNNENNSSNNTAGGERREKEPRGSYNANEGNASSVAASQVNASSNKSNKSGGEAARVSRVANTNAVRVTHRGVLSLDTLLTFMRSYGACLSEVQLPYLLPYDEYVAYVKHELAVPGYTNAAEEEEEGRRESLTPAGNAASGNEKRMSGQSGANTARERRASRTYTTNTSTNASTATTMVTKLILQATKEPLSPAQFHYRAAHAWTTVVLEVVRVFYLSQFSLEAMVQRWPRFAELLAATNYNNNNNTNTRANTNGGVVSNRAGGGATEMSLLRQGLAGSNVYSAEEGALLLWLQRVSEGYGSQEGNVFGSALSTNTAATATATAAGNNNTPGSIPALHPQSFADLSDCRPYIAAVLYTIPELPAARLFFAGQYKLVAQPATGGEHESNAQLLLNALATLGLAQLPSAKELRNFSQAEHVLFTATLFDFLAQFRLSGTIQFTGKLLATITETVELENRSDFTRSYAVLLDDGGNAYGYYKRYNTTPSNGGGGSASGFTSSHTEISVPAHSTASVQLSFCPRFPRPSYGRCFFIDHSPVLLEERQPLVFALQVDPTSDPLEIIELETPLYEALQTDVPVRNPFARDCVVNVRVTQEFVATSTTTTTTTTTNINSNTFGGGGGGNNVASAKNTPSVANDDTSLVAAPSHAPYEERTGLGGRRAPEVQGCARYFSQAFIVATDVLPLRVDETSRLPLTCVPLMRGQYLLKLTFYDDREGEFAYWVRLTCTTPTPGESSVEFRAELGEVVRVRALVRPSNHVFERAVRLFEERHRQAQASHHRALLSRPTQQAQSQAQPQNVVFSAAEFMSTQVHNKQSNLSYSVAVVNESMQGPHPFLEPEAATLVLSDSNTISTANAKGNNNTNNNNNNTAAVPVYFSFKPSAVGLYRGFIVLSSAVDIRVLRFSGECVAKGQRQTLHFSCPARQSISQEITITNNSHEKDWLITASLEGNVECFSGPKEIRVGKGRQKDYSLRYAPAWVSETTDKATLVLCNEATGQRHTYALVGKAEAPLSEETLTVACRARERRSLTLAVPNVLVNANTSNNAVAAHDCTYTVETDLPFVHGKPPATLTVPRASLGRYTLELLPTVGGHYTGKIVFHTHGGRFVWFVVQLEITPPEKEDTVVIETDVRTSVMVRVQVSNPLTRPLTFAVRRHGAGLFGEDAITLAASATAHYDCLFLPTHIGAMSGRLSFSDNAVGEFWYALEMHVRDAPAEEIQFDPAPLGTAAVREVRLTNITQCECALLLQNSNPGNFRVQPAMVLLPPHGEATVQIVYTATAVHTTQSAVLVFSHALLGQWRYQCSGQGIAPLPAPLRRCVCERRATTLLTIPFTNTLDREARLRCTIKDAEETNTSSGNSKANAQKTAAGHRCYFTLRHSPEQGVGPGATVSLTLAYSPQEVGCHRAVLEVRPEITGPTTLIAVSGAAAAVTNKSSSSNAQGINSNNNKNTTVVQAGAYDVVWQYPLEGMAEWRDEGTPFSFRCAARKQCEKVILLRAVGRHAASASLNTSRTSHTPEEMKLSFEPDAQQHYEAAVKASFECSLLPVNGSTTAAAAAAAPEATNASLTASLLAAGDAETFAVRVRFAPLRPLVASGDLVLYQPPSEGGGCWRYRVYLEALPAPPDDLIALESAYRARTTISFDLFNVFPYKSRFAAYFTTDSSRDFTVQPAHGVLLPFVQGQRTAPAATPLYVSFTPSTRVPQVEGLLVVDTEDMQWSFRVTGRLNSQLRLTERQ